VVAGAIAGLALPGLLLALPERIADVTVALPDPALLLVAVLEVRDVDTRDRDRDGILALARDHLALGDVLAEVLLDLAADDLAEPAVVEIDLLRHPIPLEHHVGDVAAVVDEAQPTALALRVLHHLEQAEGAR